MKKDTKKNMNKEEWKYEKKEDMRRKKKYKKEKDI